jgi:hypothetical protein
MDPGPDRVLGPARAGRVDRAALDLVALRGLPPVDRVELTDLVVQVVRADLYLADLHLADPMELGPVDLVHQHLAVRVAPADTHPVGLVVPAELDLVSPVVRPDLTVVPADLGLVAPVDLVPAGLAGQVDLNPVGPVVRVAPVDLDRVDLVDRVDRVAPDLMDPVGRVVTVDHRRHRMCSMAPSTAVARNSAVRETRRTASAHPIMVLRRRPRSVGSAGTTGLLLGIRRRTGMDRRLPVAGTVRRLPVAGTLHGTVPAAT